MNKTQIMTDQTNLKDMLKIIFKIALPMALQGVLLSLVQLVDNLFLGHLESATDIAAGVNAINNISFIINTIAVGFMSGIGIYFAQASGKGDEELKRKLFICKIFWTLIWSIFLITIAIIFLKNIAQVWLPNNENIDKATNAARDYGIIIFPSLIIDYIVIMFSSSFKEQKRTWLAMVVASVAIVVNASLNYPFMYSLKMGIKGSALATMIARFVEMAIWIAYVLKKKFQFLPKFKDFRNIKLKELFMIFPKSFWWMLNGFLGSLAFTLQIMFMSRISVEAGGALNIAGVMAQLVYAFVNGYSLAIGILVMHNLVQVKKLNIKRYARKLSFLSIGFGLIAGLILGALSFLMIFLYPNYSHHTRTQAQIMLLSIGSTIFIGLWTSVYISILKGTGYAKVVIGFDALYSWAISLATTFFLVYYAKNSIDFGYIYWIVGATILFKPIFMKTFISLKGDLMKPIIANESQEGEVKKLWQK